MTDTGISRSRQCLRGLLISVAVTLVLAGECRSAVPLFPNPYFDTGKRPVSIVLADFNGDGRQDIATANLLSNDVSILLGEGDGGFLAQTRIPVGSSPIALVVADFNLDGRRDLAVGLSGSSQVAVLLGQGDGTFAPARQFPVSASPQGLATGDFNGDGRPDLAVSYPGPTYYPGYVTVFLGTGDGSLASAGALPVGFSPAGLAVADFNADGIQDLVVAEFGSDRFTLHLGHGDGTFGPAVAAVGAIDAPVVIATGDFNEDGAPDVVVGARGLHFGLMGVFVYLGDGKGGFSASYGNAGLYGPDVHGIALGDFNADGHVDIAASDQVLRTEIYLGRGNGLFDKSIYVGGGYDGSCVAAGEFNGDGRTDLAICVDQPDGRVLITLGLGDGTFGPQPRSPLFGFSFSTGDFNCDGVRDVISAGGTGIAIAFGRGDGSFGPATTISISPLGANSVAVGNFDGSSCDDFAVSTGAGGYDIVVFLNRGDGTFLPGVEGSVPGNPVSILAADFNGDGITDLAVAAPDDNRISVRLGVGDGTFSFHHDSPATSPVFLAAGDFNGDGRQDLAVSRKLDQAVSVLLSRGDGTFGPETDTGMKGTVAIADFNADSIPDLAVAVFGDVAILPGRGDGSFAPPIHSVVDGGEYAVAADFDGDGRIDLAATQQNAVQIFIGDGRGNLRGGDRVWAGEYPYAFVADDFNGDGRLDIGIGGTVLMNNGVANHPPVADAGPDATLECSSPAGIAVRLDGSRSSDADSPPGTGDDIVLYEWFENFGRPGEIPLGAGRVLDITLPLGVHLLTLRVTDRASAMSTDDVVITVADTTPPALVLSVDPPILWPPNHRLVPVSVSATSADLCGAVSVVLQSLSSSEPDDAPGGGDGSTVGDIQGAAIGTADFAFDLRAERGDAAGGRTYTVTYSATDASGNRTQASALVVVPHDRNGTDEPLVLTVTESAAGTLLDWEDVPGAGAYNVVRGQVDELHLTPDAIVLGPVSCLAAGRAVSDTLGEEDAASPALGSAFFYLAEYSDGLWSAYGTASGSLPRVILPGEGGCP